MVLREPDAGKIFSAFPDVSPVPAIADESDCCEMVAISPAMRHLREQVENIADIKIPLLLLGESGVGKEVVARLVHRVSARRNRTFLKVNCAALPEDLVESELFGYEAGAYTGAVRTKPGKFELCNKGTIFLDEIGELSTRSQAKLLQVLEEQQFSRLGGSGAVRVDVRIVAATNIDMRQSLETKQFRRDLYYRLNAVTLRLPPLRARSEDILPLLMHFRAQLSQEFGGPEILFPADVIKACLAYSWPGNVRELQNFVKRFLILGETEDRLAEITESERRTDSPPTLLDLPACNPPSDLKGIVRQVTVQAETEAIRAALTQAEWDRERTARSLDISTKTLTHKMHLYEIVRPPSSQTARGASSSLATSAGARGDRRHAHGDSSSDQVRSDRILNNGPNGIESGRRSALAVRD